MDDADTDGVSVRSDQKRDGALQLVLAEYQFVAGLIPFYRGVEMRGMIWLDAELLSRGRRLQRPLYTQAKDWRSHGADLYTRRTDA
jgi:hypothetical protein